MPYCQDPGCDCNRPRTPPLPTLNEVTDWWQHASFEERRAFIQDIGGSVETTHHGISKYEVGSVYL